MKKLEASAFKATCLKVMDEVAESGEPVLITKNGKPVGQFVPYHKAVDSLSGICSGQIEIHSDILDPIDEPWDAAS